MPDSLSDKFATARAYLTRPSPGIGRKPAGYGKDINLPSDDSDAPASKPAAASKPTSTLKQVQTGYGIVKNLVNQSRSATKK